MLITTTADILICVCACVCMLCFFFFFFFFFFFLVFQIKEDLTFHVSRLLRTHEMSNLICSENDKKKKKINCQLQQF